MPIKGVCFQILEMLNLRAIEIKTHNDSMMVPSCGLIVVNAG